MARPQPQLYQGVWECVTEKNESKGGGGLRGIQGACFMLRYSSSPLRGLSANRMVHVGRLRFLANDQNREQADALIY
jgi:hypothetical protein